MGSISPADMDPKSTPYTILEEPLITPRPIRIITIGAGISGLNMIRTLRKTLTNYTHVVYEKNSDVGGTWHENRYPGCECDHPSHNYQFTWRKNPHWSQFSAGAREIERYILHVCEEEGLRKEIRTAHEVVAAAWGAPSRQWVVRVRDLRTGETFEDRGEFLLNATGILKSVSRFVRFLDSG
jgi:cation diffusion facilitator CzcD-associated flavoprotein CzcO